MFVRVGVQSRTLERQTCQLAGLTARLHEVVITIFNSYYVRVDVVKKKNLDQPYAFVNVSDVHRWTVLLNARLLNKYHVEIFGPILKHEGNKFTGPQTRHGMVYTNRAYSIAEVITWAAADPVCLRRNDPGSFLRRQNCSFRTFYL